MATVTYLNDATNETYSKSAFDYISTLRVKTSIIDTSATLGISAGAIAGAMAEENTAFGFTDEVLDLYAKSGFEPGVAITTLPAAILGGASGAAVWIAANTAQLATTRSHAEWQLLYGAAKSFNGAPGLTDKIANPALIDAGLGNFKIATAIDVIVNHASKTAYAALNLTPYLTNYLKLVEDLMNPAGELTAKLYGLYMKEYAEPFFKNNSAYAGQWDSLPQTFRDALLVTYTNIGEKKMTELMKTPYEPQPALTTGGGMNHLHNAVAIGAALGLAGYGSDAIGVDDFAVQAKIAGESGLAARYALLQLRHVAIDGIDYGAKNINGILDLYASSGGGLITESWITDRAQMLNWKLRYDIEKKSYSSEYNTSETEGNWDFVDLGTRLPDGTPLTLAIDGTGVSASDHQIVFGTQASETLEGSGDSDHLYGMAGNDILEGKGGNDTLEGGQGSDIYKVGEGSDTILDSDKTGALAFDGDTLSGGRRMGSTLVWASEGGKYLYTVDGTDLRVSSGTGDDGEVRIRNFINGDLGIQLTGDGLVSLYGRHDRVFGGTLGESISTLDQDDVVFADAGNDRVYAGSGADIVYAGAGQDLVYGETGDDLILGDVSASATGNADQLFGGEGRDLIDGHGGNDLLAGGNDIGDITLAGEAGQGDWLNGGKGDDSLYGSTRGDLLAGGAGGDTLYGGGGDDVLTGDGDYRPDYAANYIPVVAYSAIQMGIELGILHATLAAQPGLYLEALNTLGQLQSGDTGLPGGGLGTDWMWNAATQRYDRSAPGYWLSPIAQAHDWHADFSGADFTLVTSLARNASQFQVAAAGGGADVLDGGAGNDHLYGGEGADTLTGGAGNDTLTGGSGADTYRFATKRHLGVDDGHDRILDADADGADRIEVGTGILPEHISLSLAGSDLVLTLDAANTLTVENYGGGRTLAAVVFADGTEWSAGDIAAMLADSDGAVEGGPGDDTLVTDTPVSHAFVVRARGTAAAGAAPIMDVWVDGRLVGTAEVAATGYADYTFSSDFTPGEGASLDVVFRNDAVIDGEDRNLYVDSIRFDDRVFRPGDAGVAYDRGGGSKAFDGANVIAGQSGMYWNGALRFDLPVDIAGSAGDDTLLGHAGNDVLNGGGGSDRLNGGTGNDLLLGERGVDTLKGEAGDDILQGGSESDILQGGAGNDTLRGDGAGEQRIVVRARGSLADGVAPVMTVHVDGQSIGMVAVSNAGYTDYEFTGNLEAGTASTIDVMFANDAVIAGEDRNLFVESIRVGDQIMTPTMASYDRGRGAAALDGRDVIAGQSGMYWNGALRFQVDATLFGAAGDDTLDGGTGDDLLQGGAGNDTYLFGRNAGADRISDTDGTIGNSDLLSFGTDITAEQIWLRRVGSDLELSLVGTTDKATVVNWYAGSTYHVERLQTADGKALLDSQVDALVSAMAGFAPPAAGQTTLPPDYQTALSPVIAANWR